MPRATAPRALRLLEGASPGRDSGKRVVNPTPKFKRQAPDPPQQVLDDREALDEWRRIVPTLERLDLVKEQDRSTLTSYCLAWSDYLRARRMFTAENTPRTWKIRNEADRLLHRWVRELGLSPSAESIWERPVDDGDPEANPFG